ncbi:Hypothetical protein POVR2_LOCUS317, partial [uncultured virus]
VQYIVDKPLQFRHNANWLSIASLLEANEIAEYEDSSDSSHVSDALLRGYLSNLDELLVGMEIYGDSIDSDTYWYAMTQTTDLEVLKYIQGNMGCTTLHWKMLEEHIMNDHILDHLLTLPTESPTEQGEGISSLLCLGIEYQDIRILQLLEPYKHERRSDYEALDAAINTGDLEIFKYVFEHYDSNETHILERIVSSDALDIFKYWVVGHPIDDDDLMSLLLQSMSRSIFGDEPIEIADYIESIVDIDWDELLDEAIWSYPNALMRIISRPNSSTNIYDLLDRMTKTDHTPATISMFSEHSTMRVENMPTGLACRVFEGLLRSERSEAGRLKDKLRTYERATALVRGLPQDFKTSYLESQQATSIILRQFIFKAVTKKSLMDWLIELKPKQVSLAAATVLDSSLTYSDEIAPIRALLISMLYPKMTLGEATAALRREGYRGEVLTKTAGLLGLYYDRGY